MNYKHNLNSGGKTLPQIGVNVHSHASLPNADVDNSRMSVLDQGADTLNDEDPYNTEFGPRANPYDMKYSHSVSQRNQASEEILGDDPGESHEQYNNMYRALKFKAKLGRKFATPLKGSQSV
jgi:hypothetical protein